MSRSDYQDPSPKTVKAFLAADYGRETAKERWHWLTWPQVLAIAGGKAAATAVNSRRRRTMTVEQEDALVQRAIALGSAHHAFLESGVSYGHIAKLFDERGLTVPRLSKEQLSARGRKVSDDELRAAAAAGKTPEQIAQERGMHVATVKLRGCAIGLIVSDYKPRPPVPPRLTPPEEVLRALHADGVSPVEISQRFGVKSAAVRMHMRRIGLTPRYERFDPRRRLPPAREVMQQVRAGVPQIQIAATFGVSPASVCQLVSRAHAWEAHHG